jgi:tetratricopeptide (TPR) repeat protein
MPFADQQDSAYILSNILEYDPHNGIVMVLRAYMQYWYSRLIHNKSWVDELSSVVTGDAEIDSMMRYVASLYYEIGDQDIRENLLMQSINLCQDHVYNYRDLAMLYLKQGKFEKAAKLMGLALKNIKKIYRGCKPDITDYHSFIMEFITGIGPSASTAFEMRVLKVKASILARLQKDQENKKLLLDLANIELRGC